MTNLPLRRQLLFTLLTVFLVVLLLETFSAAIFWVAEGQTFSWARQDSRRADITGAADDAAARAQKEGLEALIGPRNADVFTFREILHPFLGFVANPALNETEDRQRRGELVINDDGLYERPDTPPIGSADVEVGIFGGSVAWMFCIQGRDALVSALQDLEPYRGKSLAVRCYALGGYKQPQQLMGLAYLLSQGRPLDLAINLDGFNEVALAFFDNYNHQVAPHYPRGWKERVDDFSDRQVQWLLGRAAFLQQKRVALARRFAAEPWRRSITANLVWRLLDRWVRRDLVVAQKEAADFVPAEQSYEWQGPYREIATPELYRSFADNWSRSSLQMARLCAANGIDYFHFLQPNQYVPDSKPMGREERAVAVNAYSSYRTLIPDTYPLLQRAGRELAANGVRFEDLTDMFQAVEAPVYVDDCCHLNQVGSELLAASVARSVARSVTETAPESTPKLRKPTRP